MSKREETIAHVAFEYRVDGLARTAYRGEVHDVSGWDSDSVVSAGAHGVFAPKVEKLAVAPPNAKTASIAELADFIASSELNAKDTTALAGGDPELAAKVLEAEQIATGGAPRKGVFKALAAVMNTNE
jgi:hypothetical protein